jgi:protein-S-isoprenylcysteine O-methyltransferase Ste14
MLIGLAIAMGSVLLAAWALAFLLVNHMFFLAFEEPDLERRFGQPYRDYKRTVSRWIPRHPID